MHSHFKPALVSPAIEHLIFRNQTGSFKYSKCQFCVCGYIEILATRYLRAYLVNDSLPSILPGNIL